VIKYDVGTVVMSCFVLTINFITAFVSKHVLLRSSSVVMWILSQHVYVQIGEARALYNLGNVCHARAKAIEQKTANLYCCPPDVEKSLLLAIDFYK